MPENRPTRLLLTIFLAFVVSAALAVLLVILVVPAIGDGGCPFWTYPTLILDTLAPDAVGHIECMDSSGNLHTYRNVFLLEWAASFTPIFIISLICIFVTEWMRRRARKN